MSDAIVRPEASVKKIHSKDEFELCYLRHRYFRRVKFNPTIEQMEPYFYILKHISNNTYTCYQGLFSLVGLERDDLMNVARVHLVSFLGLFEITIDPVKYEKFLCAFQKKHTRDPKERDILDKNKAIFTLFLKQRMQDTVRVCRQKAQNIRGMPTEEFYAYEGKKRIPPWVLPLLPKNNERLGYRKIDVATFKSFRKKAKPVNPNFFRFNELWYISIGIDHRPLAVADLEGADMDPRDNYHNLNPEQFLDQTEQLVEFENKIAQFQSMTPKDKIVVFEAFIRENKGNKRFSEEVGIARKLITKIGKDVGNL